MTKILKNRLVIVILCSLLALAALIMYTRSVQSEAEKVNVVRMTANVPKGEIITEKSIDTVTVGGYNLNKSVMKSKDDVIGKYAATDLIKGGYVMKGNLSDNILSTSDRLEQLDGSRVAYSITIKEFANGLSDKLINGDIVSLYVNKSDKTVAPPELSYVEVLATTTSKGIDREEREEESDNLATVTLLVSPKQAKILTNYEDTAEIHLALVYRGDRETAQKFLDNQDEVLSHE